MIFLYACYIIASRTWIAHNNTVVAVASDERTRMELMHEKGGKMIKLKDCSAKLHKYFSKTFGVVNLNVEHTHIYNRIYAMCSANTQCCWHAAVCLPYSCDLCFGIFTWFSIFRLRKLLKFLVEHTEIPTKKHRDRKRVVRGQKRTKRFLTISWIAKMMQT